MCVAGEEEEPGASVDVATGGTGTMSEILVTAPRIGLDPNLMSAIDWAEIAKIAGFAAAGGAYSGGLSAGLSAGLAAAAGAIESVEGVDIEDLFVIKNDIIVVPGLGPYIPLY